MYNVVFLIFRRMRRPLLTLVAAYSIAVLGLVLIPGQDASGEPWSMSFFHALYFVSFMATTIGFGEIPYPFTDAQRIWVILSIYGTVVVWFYAIGTLLRLVQDKGFQQALTEMSFTRKVKRIREPFYLICGYGETGKALVHALTDRDQQVVVIDIAPGRINLLELENLRQYVPGLCGDAASPTHLLEAGLSHNYCAGVVALTNVNEVNLKVAITSKLLHPDIKTICRADSHDVEANMHSFGTNAVIDPFDTFANHLAIALQVPGLYLLQNWLTSMRYQKLIDPVYPPGAGLWIICGFGRFGKAIYQRLKDEGLELVVIEARPDITGVPDADFVVGRGTEGDTLQEAGIDRAQGLVAGTDDDSNNLSIIMTAMDLNRHLFVVARQNEEENQAIFGAVKADMVMHPSTIIANKIRVQLATPMLYEFTGLAMLEDDAWACELVSRVSAVVRAHAPVVWEVAIDSKEANAVCNALGQGGLVTLADILSDPRDRDITLSCIPLLLLHGGGRVMVPDLDTALKRGDRILFCGHYIGRNTMEWALQNEHALSYILTGKTGPQGWLWQKLRSL
ncbi:MAG: potassium transporter TrkA [Gammaproteobacteria bacterium]|nr:potassium transporter TrkA [Gammaproteobacteria bacterium]